MITEFAIADVIEHRIPREELPENNFYEIPREEFPENNFHTSIY